GDIVLKVCSHPLPVPSELNPLLPPAFDAWFARACDRDPGRRFKDVESMSRALTQLDQWAEVEKETSSFEIRPRQPSRLEIELAEYQPPSRGRFLAGLLGGVAVTIALVGYLFFQRTRAATEATREAAARAAAALEAQNRPTEAHAHPGVSARSNQWGAADAGASDAAAEAPPPP